MRLSDAFSLEYFQKRNDTGLGAAFGLVQTLVAPGKSSLLSFNSSAEYEGLAGIMGERQHTLWNMIKFNVLYHEMYKIWFINNLLESRTISRQVSSSPFVSAWNHRAEFTITARITYEFTSSSFLSSLSFSRQTSSWSRITWSRVIKSSAFSRRNSSFSCMYSRINLLSSDVSISANLSKSTGGGVLGIRRSASE